MINESARILREVKEMKQKLDFRYIIVDEYQDISRQRFDLVTSLHEVTAAKIIAVGDVLGIPTLFIYTLVWMARIAEALKDKAIELGIEGPHTSWWHMFGWNTFGFLLFGPAVATHRFFRTLNSEEQELNQRGAVSCPQI